MAPKAAHEAAKKKAAKQRKILMVLAVPLVGALVYAYMTVSALGGPPKVSGTPAAATVPAGSVPSATAAAAVLAGITAPPVGSLSSFAGLGRKDPFNDNGPSASSSTTTTSTTGGKGSGSGSQPKQPPAPLTGAVILLNGNKLALALGAKFGHAPGVSGVALFRLLTVSRTTALIGVVGTQQHFLLHVLSPLTLEQVGGWRYTLTLEPPAASAPMTVAPTTLTTTVP